MNLKNKLSLRLRITLVTGLIVIVASLGLTFISMYNVQKQFMSTSLLEESFTALTAAVAAEAVPADSQPAAAGKTVPADSRTPVNAETVPATIIIDALPAPILDAKKLFDLTSVLYLFIICIIGMAAAYFVSGRALQPIQELDSTAARITEQNLAERIPETGAADEISSLAHSFNSMLERLEQSFSRQKQFSANVAHELKTPLATMNAGIQVLNLDAQPAMEDCLETLDIVQHNINRLMDVVNGLSLLTEERAEESSDEIPLDKLFEEIIEELEPLYAEKSLEVSRDIQMDSIVGNRTLVQRAFFNLVENAMKYSQENGTVSIRACDGQIFVINTGDGIPATDLDRVFEPFYRVDSSRSRKTGGAGLGLSIVKTIVEKHGWSIEVQSIPGQETVMKVRCVQG